MRLAWKQELSYYLAQPSSDFIERFPDLVVMETGLVSTTSALEPPVTANPSMRLAALLAAIRAENDLEITGIEWVPLQSRDSLGQGSSRLLRRSRVSSHAGILTQSLQIEILPHCGLIATSCRLLATPKPCAFRRRDCRAGRWRTGRIVP